MRTDPTDLSDRTAPAGPARSDIDHRAITSAVEEVMARRHIPGLSLATPDADR